MAVATSLVANMATAVVLQAVDVREAQAHMDCLARASTEAARRHADGVAGPVPGFHDTGCVDPRPALGWLVPLVATGGLLLVLAAVYLALPRWRTVRRGYLPLTAMGELSGYLGGLLRETGVRARVTFLAEPLNPTVSALAFGRAGRRRVVLSGGLLALHQRDRPAFRAVVLHELAHIRNRDLDIGFVALIVWRTCGPVLLVVATLSLFLSPAAGNLRLFASLVLYSAELALLAVLVTLLGSAVLRSRELYADARVREWEDSGDSLRRLFEVYGPGVRGARTGTAAGRLKWLVRVHPSPERRMATLVDTRPLTRPRFWDMAAVGAAVGFFNAVAGLGPGGGGFRSGSAPDVLASVLSALLLLAAGGTVVWRAVADGAAAPAQLRNAGIGLGLGLGVTNLLGTYRVWVQFGIGGSGLSSAVPYAVLTCLAGWVLVRWLASVARAWQPVLERTGRARLVPALVLTVLAAGLFTTVDLVLRLPGLMTYAAAYFAPDLPGPLLLVWGIGRLLGDRLTSHVLPLLLTAALVPVAGYALARRTDRAAQGFGDPLPTAGLAVRLGVPAALVAAAGNLVAAVLLPSLPVWSLLALFGAGQLWAALRATRDHAPLRLARGLTTVLSCGALAFLAFVMAAEVLATCLDGACTPLPDAGQTRTVLLGVSVTSGPAWALFALQVSLTGAYRRRTGRAPGGAGRRSGTPVRPHL
ncbi:M48 family metalloprotease [Streptomyces abyssomicinicus]|uniref:M48 family metalloprotease n=1 Tax=Streptomyces abyssomicinicus TaxID=574929 RepID=UPI001C3F7B61|nr:M48 family metalloprotease [Streptomyces abyssomicinicus]